MSYVECTSDSGIELEAHKLYRQITDALYYAAVGSLYALRGLSNTVSMLLPSGIRLRILVDGSVPDFRVSVKRHWAWSLGIGGYNLVSYRPLPATGVKDMYQALVAPIDYYIPGTEDSLMFPDADGEYALGNTFTPQKQYGLLTHGVLDGGTLVLVLAIGYLLHKTGLDKMAIDFVKAMVLGVKSIYNALKDQRAKFQREETYEAVQDILTAVSGLPTFDSEEKLDELLARVGLRMTL